jgi:hypothetical protein
MIHDTMVSRDSLQAEDDKKYTTQDVFGDSGTEVQFTVWLENGITQLVYYIV